MIFNLESPTGSVGLYASFGVQVFLSGSHTAAYVPLCLVLVKDHAYAVIQGSVVIGQSLRKIFMYR